MTFLIYCSVIALTALILFIIFSIKNIIDYFRNPYHSFIDDVVFGNAISFVSLTMFIVYGLILLFSFLF